MKLFVVVVLCQIKLDALDDEVSQASVGAGGSQETGFYFWFLCWSWGHSVRLLAANWKMCGVWGRELKPEPDGSVVARRIAVLC